MDIGTAMYYLQSRYYDPILGRFLNADAFASTGQGLLGNNMFAYCGNNPIVFVDATGTWRKPTTVAICDGGSGYYGGGQTTGSPVGGQGMNQGAGAALGLGLFLLLQQTIEDIAELISQVEKHVQQSRENDGIYTVYMLCGPGNTIQYVGRTKSPIAREQAHKNSFRGNHNFMPIMENLTYSQARGLEQVLMLYCHTIENERPTDWKGNFINGISRTNSNLEFYLKAAESALGYTWNQVSNEVLNWAER